MFFFTGHVKEVLNRWILGYVFTGLAYLCIVLNLVVIFIVTLKWIKLYLKKKSAKKWQTRWKKEVEANPELQKPKRVFKPTVLPLHKRNKVAAVEIEM